MEPFVPLIDLTAWYHGDESARVALASEVDRALAASGFLLVTSHGVDESIRLRLRAAAHELFALPDDVKDRYSATPTSRGFVPVGREANAYSSGEESPPDLKQSFSFSNEMVPSHLVADADLYPPNRWPTEVAGLTDLVRAWTAEMLRLAGDLAEVFAVALGLDPRWLRSRTDDPFWTLGLNWYPPVTVVGAPQPGQFRIGPHTDFGVLTILDRQVGMGGLQVQRDDGSWEDAPFVPGALTVNLGDLMARWTGDRWRSARHRVLPPPTSVDESLLSLVFFDEGNLDEMVETLPPPIGGPNTYEPIRAADYLRLKLEQISV